MGILDSCSVGKWLSQVSVGLIFYIERSHQGAGFLSLVFFPSACLVISSSVFKVLLACPVWPSWSCFCTWPKLCWQNLGCQHRAYLRASRKNLKGTWRDGLVLSSASGQTVPHSNAVMLSQRSLTQKATQGMILFTWNSRKGKTKQQKMKQVARGLWWRRGSDYKEAARNFFGVTQIFFFFS